MVAKYVVEGIFSVLGVPLSGLQFYKTVNAFRGFADFVSSREPWRK